MERRNRGRTFVSVGLALVIGLAIIATTRVGDAATLPVVSLTAAVVHVVEGNTGTSTVQLTVTLTPAATSPVTVQYTTTNGTATAADADFVATAGTLSFAPGETSHTIDVAVKGDTKLEDFQTFAVKLSAPTGATIRGATEPVEIRNDERPKFALAGVAVNEGASARFIPKLAQRYYLPLTATAQTADRTATAPSDYTASTGPLTFAIGSKTAGNVTVPVIADGIAEPKETFALTVSSPDAFAPLTKLGTIAASTGISVCNTGAAAPSQYQSVVVFSFENRRWSQVGGVGFGAIDMPYAHTLATQCSTFTTWTEAITTQNSASQYVSQGQGDTSHTVLNDCHPSATCHSESDNIFRQGRTAGKTAINYVEGATSPCSATGNAVKHIPAMYYFGADDQAACTAQVRPYSEFDPLNLPAFAFVTPTLCNDGHDCPNATVDTWMQQNIGPVIASPDYQAGKVLIEIWYDEDTPAPNVYLSPSAHPGPFATTGIGYASTLKLWEDVLALPCLANACTAPDIRSVTGV